jgi:hypothetical protein
MIVWLASFPRSGNTLLRQVLAEVFHLASFSDEVTNVERVAWTPAARQRAGIKKIDQPWAEFFRQATESAEIHLVKTHRLPRDDQPAIYVVRDGRRALTSYAAYHQSFSPSGQAPDLMDLVLGRDFYGSWSDHFHAWTTRGCSTLLVRYEELVDPTTDTLSRLADFVKVRPAVESWRNPFEELHSMDPRFFRQGMVEWQAPEIWTSVIDQIFLICHGDLMVQLGYCSPETVSQGRHLILPEHARLVDMVLRLGRERDKFQAECDKRLSVIEGLKAACDERLALINRLSTERN